MKTAAQPIKALKPARAPKGDDPLKMLVLPAKDGMAPPYWVGFDFDGTLAEYVSGTGQSWPGRPIVRMVELCRRFIAQGYRVKIFTARVSSIEGTKFTPQQAKICWREIAKWCKAQFGQVLEITNKKDQHMIALYDDHVRQVVPNLGMFMFEKLRDVFPELYTKENQDGHGCPVTDK